MLLGLTRPVVLLWQPHRWLWVLGWESEVVGRFLVGPCPNQTSLPTPMARPGCYSEILDRGHGSRIVPPTASLFLS